MRLSPVPLCMRTFFRFLLNTFGAIAILIGLVASLVMMFNPLTESDGSPMGFGFTLFAFLCGIFLPFGGGYLLIGNAERLQTPAGDPDSPGSRTYKLGLAMMFYFIFALTVCLSITGRLVVAALLLLVFTRIHRPWSARKFQTPVGRISWGDVFDFGLGAMFWLLLNLVVALLTGGRGPTFGGGGGSFGGGGSSGRW